MEHLLRQRNGLDFRVSDTFSGKMLVPIIQNVYEKAENDWDDYDEVYHCCQLIETVKQNPAMTMDFHTIQKEDAVLGIGLVTHGTIDLKHFFPDISIVTDPVEKILVFNYFHVAPEGRGNGESWLRDIIIPHYADKGFLALYVKSSHPRVFSLYGRLGEKIGEYSSRSDNGLYLRPGKIFRVPIK